MSNYSLEIDVVSFALSLVLCLLTGWLLACRTRLLGHFSSSKKDSATSSDADAQLAAPSIAAGCRKSQDRKRKNIYRKKDAKDRKNSFNPTQQSRLINDTVGVIRFGDAEILDGLLQYGHVILDAPVEVKARNQKALDRMLHTSTEFIPNEKKQATCRVLVRHAKSTTSSSKGGITMDFLCTSIDVCRLMVQQHGIDPFPQTEDEASLFQSAASQSDTEIFAFFLDHWNDRFLLANDGKDDHGRFPIHVICRFSSLSLSALQLVMERQAHTLAIAAPLRVAVSEDGQQQQGQEQGRLFPFLTAGVHDANLDVIYSLLRHCPDALSRQQREWKNHNCE